MPPPPSLAVLVGGAFSLIEKRMLLLLAADQLGGAQACLDASVQHARTRVQFGVPIGSFQAIQHRCADALIALENARTSLRYGLWCVDHDPKELELAASMAAICAADAFERAAGDMIQIHGAMGFTWEHPAHLYFRRAQSTRSLLGDPEAHREAIASHLFDERSEKAVVDGLIPSG
jgi:alkylation response protein AidB-like acyl-CoA dehydrogenase